MQERRVVTQIALSYATSQEQLRATPHLLRTIVERVEGLRFDRAHFSRYLESALEIELVYYVLSPDYTAFMDRQQEVNLAIMREFGRLGMKFALPSRIVYLRPEQASPSEHSASDRKQGISVPA
jgi:small-conductance mechanosensitive channel